jgi:hypothetical protein
MDGSGIFIHCRLPHPLPGTQCPLNQGCYVVAGVGSPGGER